MKEIKNVVTWLKNWFYDKNEVYNKTETYAKAEVDSAVNNKLNKNLTTANKNLVTDGSGNVILEAKLDITGKADKTGGVQQISDNNAHSYINTIANSTQGEINTAIDTAIGNLQSIKAIEVVSDKGTANADKLGKLFIVNENSKVNVYYVKQTGTGSSATYSWEKMDTNILDELVINWSDVQHNPFSSSTPSSFANASHTHGDISNDGRINNAREGSILNIVDNEGTIGTTLFLDTKKVKDNNAHSHIYTSASDTQTTINTAIDTAIGNLQSNTITSIVLVPKSTDANGKIIFYTGDEPT